MQLAKWFGIGILVAGLALMSMTYVLYGKKYGDIHTESPIQLSRIDIHGSISKDCEMEIKQNIRSLSGVDHVFVNTKDNIVVFSHYPNKVSSLDVYQNLADKTGLPMTRFQVSEEMASSGCPVTGPTTLPMTIGGRIWNFIH